MSSSIQVGSQTQAEGNSNVYRGSGWGGDVRISSNKVERPAYSWFAAFAHVPADRPCNRCHCYRDLFFNAVVVLDKEFSQALTSSFLQLRRPGAGLQCRTRYDNGNNTGRNRAIFSLRGTAGRSDYA